MNTKQDTPTVADPPKLIPSLLNGFNSIANHIYILLFPLILDLYLWLGPKISLKKLLLPSLSEFIETIKTQNSNEFITIFNSLEEAWVLLMDRFNLAISLRTYPVGVPSLLSADSPVQSPLGLASRFEISSFGTAFLLLCIFSLIGIVAGCVYFYQIARVNNPELERMTFKGFLYIFLQIISFTFFLLILAMIFSIPLSFIVSIFSLLNAGIAQIAIFVLFIIIIWMLIPLIFTPHGIFAQKKNFFTSLLLSTRMVRMTLPQTGFFFLVLILLSQGLDVLWRVPPETSWFTLIGIAGHAFISSGVISASFSYYRDGLKWVDNYLNSYKKSTIDQKI